MTVLRTARPSRSSRIHDDPARAGCEDVPAYLLHRHGWRILGVNPGLVGRELFGSPVRAAPAAELDEPYQLVDVFARERRAPAAGARPRWRRARGRDLVPAGDRRGRGAAAAPRAPRPRS
ncbi:MAG: hypothetical protein HS111_07375 [Kofleriaceae bacterium]|nr:hypothetical protein [Kofleriaceae bacterium]